MSMPSFPENVLDITQEQALNMIVASIAMEELGLSHIINAEGEKLQYILGTLEGQCGTCPDTHEILEVNKSITNLLEMVMQNQIILKGKLEKVLAQYPPPTTPASKAEALSGTALYLLKAKVRRQTAADTLHALCRREQKQHAAQCTGALL